MKIALIFSFLFGSAFLMKDQMFVASHDMTYEQAINLSQENNKLIMLKITADNCKYCIEMDNNVLADKEVKNMLLRNFITLNINVDKEALPLNLERPTTPTFIFIKKTGEIHSKLPGSWNKEDFLDLLKRRI